MALIFYIVGATFALLFILNNLYRTLRRHKKITFWELTWAFLVVVLLLVGLTIDNLQDARFDLLEQLMLLVSVPLLMTGIAFSVIEGIRPQGLKSSRGLMSIGMAGVLLFGTFSYNVASLLIEQSSVPTIRRPTPVNATPDYTDPCDFSQLGGKLSSEFLGIIATQSGLTTTQLLARFAEDGTISASQLVLENDGSPDDLIEELKAFTDKLLLGLIADGCIPAIAYPFAIGQIEPVINSSVYQPFDVLITNISGQLGGQQSASSVPTGANTPNAQQLQETRIALITAIPTEDKRPTPTLTLTATASITPSPTLTRTPLPTFSPTPTRERFATATPTMTATLPNPCLATTKFNVNLRDFPDSTESQVLVVIPFDTVVAVYAPNPDKTWWFAEFDGLAGWLNSEFITLTRSCDALPARRP